MIMLMRSECSETEKYIEEAYALPKRPGIKGKNKCQGASSATTAQKLMATTSEVLSTEKKSEGTFVESVAELSVNSTNTSTSSKRKTTQAKQVPTFSKSSTPTWGSLKFWKSEAWKDIQKKMQGNTEILPRRPFLFRPLLETPLKRVRVVLLGTEPLSYSNPDHLDGLAYSFNGPFRNINSLPIPLQNIVIEAQDDQGIGLPKTGNLRHWARQGVLLWNAIPTVRKGFPLSCNSWHWEELTAEILETVYLVNPNAVFMFWDKKTHIYKTMLPEDINSVTCAGPSVTTANAFFGSRPFSRANEMLEETGQKPIDWRIR